jgi:hypothetical protein
MAGHLWLPGDAFSRHIAIPSPCAAKGGIPLHFWRARAIDVLTAVITAKGDCEMTTSTIEETATAQATATGEQPKASKKAPVAPRRAHVAPVKAKSVRKASSAKKTPKGQKKAAARDGSKSAKVLDLLKRPDGATLKEIMKATGWQAHSVRGFLSGTVGKKMGLAVTSTKGEDGERTYRISA